MADLFSVAVDAVALLAALQKAGPSMDVRLRAVAKITADNIDHEATARVRRLTGATAEHIVVEPDKAGKGFVVYVKHADADTWANLDRGLEFGTVRAPAYPFLLDAARLESGPHYRRIEDAIAASLEESGLGD